MERLSGIVLECLLESLLLRIRILTHFYIHQIFLTTVDTIARTNTIAAGVARAQRKIGYVNVLHITS